MSKSKRWALVPFGPFPALALALALLLAMQIASAPASAQGADAAGQLAAPTAPREKPEGRPLDGPALAQRTDEVTSKLRCPVCQGLSVADSHTPTAIAMKDQARELLRLGYSESQVLEHFETSYGEFVRLEPKAEGFNLLVWIAPVLILVGGITLLAYRFTRRRPSRPDAVTSTAAESHSGGDRDALDPDLDPYLKKLREEIRRS